VKSGGRSEGFGGFVMDVLDREGGR